MGFRQFPLYILNFTVESGNLQLFILQFDFGNNLPVNSFKVGSGNVQFIVLQLDFANNLQFIFLQLDLAISSFYEGDGMEGVEQSEPVPEDIPPQVLF